MAKKKTESVVQEETTDTLAKEKTDSQIPLDSGAWVESLKPGDLLYSANYTFEDGKETVKVMVLKFKEYVKNSFVDDNTLMADLSPVIEGKESESIKIPKQNLRYGYFPSKLEAIRAFQERIEHMAVVIKEAADKLEAEENPQKVTV